ncbi:MAG: ferredoxin domain-containing protein [Candidatus Bathyarchaeia archaeon]
MFKALDLGIALGSAVKIASLLNIDNRIMYRIGTAALRLNLLPEATVAMGIPLSAKGKTYTLTENGLNPHFGFSFFHTSSLRSI